MDDTTLEFQLDASRVPDLLGEPDLEPFIPLDRAALCLDCNSVTLNSLPVCPGCGRSQLVMLQRFVDGAR